MPEPTANHSRWRADSPSQPTDADDTPRVPYPVGTNFEAVTRQALRVEGPYASVLSLLADCSPQPHLAHEQARGASYARLAAIAHLWGMSKEERVGWYRVAEDLTLSDRHASHLLGRLKKRAA